MTKPTVFFVTDIETGDTDDRLSKAAFDIAWKAIDRREKVYSKGSYIVKEAFEHATPWYRSKIGQYFQDVHDGHILPLTMQKIRQTYNNEVTRLKAKGHRVIFAAYNAPFDARYLSETSRLILGVSFMEQPIDILDIWDYWGSSVPMSYNGPHSLWSEAGNIRTTAEEAYRFEFNLPEFKEAHIAWRDVEIEADILLRTLRRKQAMHLVTNPQKLRGNVWSRINDRVRLPSMI